MPQPRRPFTVERRLMERGEPGLVPDRSRPAFRAGGGKAAALPAPAASDGAAVPAVAIPPDLLEEIRTLTREVGELRGHVETSAPPAMETDEAALRDIRIEIARMVREIGRAKSELAALKHPLAQEDRVQAAHLQLETIVSTTEEATNTIMSATDEIEDLVGRGKAMSPGDTEMLNLFDDMSNKVITIIEACSFQDLTGQRITKVIETLRFIEQRVLAMIDIWGIEAFQALPLDGEDEEVTSITGDENLSGPAMEGQGLSQSDIDALFD